MDENDLKGFWVFAEQRMGYLHDVSRELLGKARELANQANKKVSALLLGHRITHLAQILINAGADAVFVADDVRLNDFRLIPYAFVLEGLIRKYDPEILLMGATSMGVELAPRVAAKVGSGLSAHCVDLKLNSEGKLIQVVPGWEGGVIATITCPDHIPQMATVMPGAMKSLSEEDREGKIIEVPVQLPDKGLGPRVLEVKMEKPVELPLEKAEVVVAGGWGVGNREDWELIERLARVMGGAVGATRPPVDEGWVPEDQMIGQSGKTVSPRLYIGVGISGFMHHVVGMDQSKHVISINTDPNSEIFASSDLIVVEDFREIVPALIEEIKSRQKR
jgi:electron transfer flavoprotein alpha subunit